MAEIKQQKKFIRKQENSEEMLTTAVYVTEYVCELDVA